MVEAERELISILSLVDDPDVGGVIKEQLKERGEEAIAAIAAIRNKFSEIDIDIIDSLIAELEESVVISKLKKALDLSEPSLSRVFFLITKLADPECDESIWNGTIEDFIVDLSLEISVDKTAIENMEVFNYLFFTKFGFRYVDTELKREDCALINRSLISREGNAIAISLIYFLLSREVGLPVYPLCFSKGFIPVYLDRRGEIVFYLNVFDRGSIFMRENLKDILKEMESDDMHTVIGQERSLAEMYVEMLLFLYGNMRYSDKVSVFEKAKILISGGKDRP